MSIPLSLVLNEEQRLLKDAAHHFLQEHIPLTALRTLRDSQATCNYTATHWQKMTELGWPAISIAESYGGLGFGYVGLGQIFEEIGRQLSGTPLFSTLVLGASAIELIGSEQQKHHYLPQLAQGQLKLALAFEEHNHYRSCDNIQCQAHRENQHYRINGQKILVLNAHSADKVLVVAQTDATHHHLQSLGLFILNAHQAGIEHQLVRLLDGTTTSTLVFTNALAEDMLGTLDQTHTGLQTTLDRATIILTAEMLGSSLEVFQRTLGYLKEREQFGVKIGSFQALKHRAAHMFVQLELCKSVVMTALTAIDQQTSELALFASLAKTMLNETYTLITDEATQMHGGMGVTDELDVGLFLKRARVYKQLLGDTPYHRERYARLLNY